MQQVHSRVTDQVWRFLPFLKNELFRALQIAHKITVHSITASGCRREKMLVSNWAKLSTSFFILWKGPEQSYPPICDAKGLI